MEETKAENIHEGHRRRLMEVYLREGASALTDVELLELLLTYAVPRRDTNPTAHRLLRELGGLHRVFEGTVPVLNSVEGVGPRSAALVTLVRDLWRRSEQARLEGETVLRSMREVGAYLVPRMSGFREERAFLLCLDARCRLILCQELCRGTVNAVNLPIRKVVEAALLCNSTSVVLAHNHTSGSMIPSLEDVEYTRQLSRTLALVDVTLNDHLIIAGRDYLSMRSSGMLPE